MARTGARAEAAEPVTERLIAAATRLFAEHGYESTSVQDVVSAAGVTKGAMYHYFDSKDALLYEIYHRLLAMQAEQLDQIAAGPAPPATGCGGPRWTWWRPRRRTWTKRSCSSARSTCSPPTSRSWSAPSAAATTSGSGTW